MAGRVTSNKLQYEDRLTKIADLYLTGHKQADIAVETGVTQKQIAYDLNILKKRWQNSSLIDFNEVKSRELTKIDVLEVEYWTAWRDSKLESVKTSTRRRGDIQKPMPDEARIERENLNGDPR